MNALHKYFEDFSKLFYWLLILTSWLLTADIVGLLFLDKTFNELFHDLKIVEILLIFMVQTIFILTSMIMYRFIQLIWLIVPKKNKKNNTIDYKANKNYYTYSELLTTAVKTNNQTMYNHFRNHKDELKSDLSQKYLCFTIILLLILSLCLEKSILKNLFDNFNSFVTIKKVVIGLLVIFDSLGLLVLFHDGDNSDYTSVKKEDDLKK